MDLLKTLPEGLEERLERGAALLEGAQRVRVLCHYDGDGTAAAALLTLALLRQGQEVHATLSRHLNAGILEGLALDGVEALVVSDMGSGQVDLLEGLQIPVVILDHHQPLRDAESEAVVQVNPHFVGLSGTQDLCGATTALLFTLGLAPGNLDLAGIALIGCIADRQHVGGFAGLNAQLFGLAQEKEILIPERSLALADLPLKEALYYSVGPYFKDLSGREKAVAQYLKDQGLDPEKRYRDLDAPTQENLVSALSLRLVDQGVRPEIVEHLVEERYWYPPFKAYADDVESYVNACARQGEESLGLALSLGDFEEKARAETIRRKHWEAVLQGLQAVEADGVFTKKAIQFFYAEGATLAGSVAGISMRYLLDPERPTVALAVSNGTTKISARGTDYLVGKGLDLAEALRDGAEAVGGSGGGHNIASGASIPKGKEEKFLGVVDGVVAKQLGGSQDE